MWTTMCTGINTHEKARSVLAHNHKTALRFFVSQVSGEYYDGKRHTLCVSLTDGHLSIRTGDVGLGCPWAMPVAEVFGFGETIREDELYPKRGTLDDYGYTEWLTMLESCLAKAFTPKTGGHYGLI